MRHSTDHGQIRRATTPDPSAQAAPCRTVEGSGIFQPGTDRIRTEPHMPEMNRSRNDESAGGVTTSPHHVMT
ncbi:hypothetical protein [Acetobacter fallax]|uniref:Uncharacterized protein n=1 Tax=Acetobacter fallax TaxID=1737473 RepID=A0ABX0KAA6_9PROT|nr:hypothetical protein [Acetobacter fallax]NHO33367.1 hypothetical protein [Acetobacter fallax]